MGPGVGDGVGVNEGVEPGIKVGVDEGVTVTRMSGVADAETLIVGIRVTAAVVTG